MGFEDCIDDVIKASGDTLDKSQAKDIIVKVGKFLDEGVSPEELRADLDVFENQRVEYINKMRRFNAIRDARIQQDLKTRVLKDIDMSQEIKVMGSTVYNPLHDRIFGVVRQHYHHGKQLFDDFKQSFDRSMKNENLVDFVNDDANSPDIYREIASISEDITRTSSVTGNDKAFRVAQKYLEIDRMAHGRKQAAGSTVQYLKGRIFKQDWDGRKLALLSDDDFYELVRDIQWDGGTAPKSQWLEFKKKVVSGNHRDFEDGLRHDGTQAEMRGAMDLATLTGKGRSIKLTPEQYVAIGNKVFKGENFLQRAQSEFRNNARILADLETFGSRPLDNFDRFIENIMVETNGQKGFMQSNGKHILDKGLFRSDQSTRSKLARTMFQLDTLADNQEAAELFGTIRSLDAVAKLSGATITALTDITTKALRNTMVSGNQNSFLSKNGVASELGKSIREFKRVVGNENAVQELKNISVGIETMFDDLMNFQRYEDRIELTETTRTGKILKGVNYFANKVFQLNGLEAWTNANLKGSMAASMHNYSQLADKTLADLNPFAKEQLELSGITDQEWDFIRQHAQTQTFRGEGLLSADHLNKIELDTYKQLTGSDNKAVLESRRNEIVSKWRSHLYREAETSTIMPDVIDKMRLNFGTRPGTWGGEAVRFMNMYRSYTFAYFARTLIPLIRHGNFATGAEYLGAGMAMAALSFTLKDLIKGRTPRDFTKSQNAMGLVGHVVGVPFLDQLTFAVNSDNVQASSFYAIGAGPIGSNLVDTIARTTRLAKDLPDGDADFGKYAARTFLPMTPFKNHPLTATIFHRGVYNGVMRSIDPRYDSKLRKQLEESGSNLIGDDRL